MVTIIAQNKQQEKDVNAQVTGTELAQQLSMEKTALAMKLDDAVVDLAKPIGNAKTVQLLTFNDAEGKTVYWHSTCHVMSKAVGRVYSSTLKGKGVGPPIENGFYQDFDMPPLAPEDLKKVEKEMERVIQEKPAFVRKEMSKDEARKLFKHDPFKLQLIDEFEDETVSVYYTGDDYYDLCRGPHVPNASFIKAYKLTKTSGAYWKGDAANPQLQRVYGISFADKKELRSYLHMLQEAEKRDHRKLGKKLDLFSIQDEAPGMPFFHHKGNVVYDELKKLMSEKLQARRYWQIQTPTILNKSLWLQSGHWDHYKENMYFTKIDNQDFAVKPMNCPGAMLVYKSNVHSYKELPLKIAEYGKVHRHELSGVLSGLFRVRVFTQDDAHLFCLPEQIEEQILELIDLVDEVYKTFGFAYRVVLSTKPEKAMGDPKLWEKAEKALESSLTARKISHTIAEGDGAFYGPKIDFLIKDAIGREWQCGTIQVDFQMPERFELEYVGEDNSRHRPVILHRAIYGSFERFLGVLIEHYAGKFPLWLAPVQVRVLTVADRFVSYAQEVVDALHSNSVRVEMDTRSESVGKKVRDAQVQKIPLVLTIGEKEMEGKTVAIRTLDGTVKFGISVDELVAAVLEMVKKRKLEIEL